MVRLRRKCGKNRVADILGIGVERVFYLSLDIYKGTLSYCE